VGPVLEPAEIGGEEASAPEPTEAKDGGASTVAVGPVVPSVVAPEMVVPEWAEGSGMIAPNTALGEASTSGPVAAAPVGDLGAGPSGPPSEGVSWAVVQRGVPEDFLRTEPEKEDIWQEQLGLGVKIDTDL